MKANGHDLIFVNIEILDENDVRVPDAKIELNAQVNGTAELAGFGSGNPITEEDYTDTEAATYKGRAMAILRSGYEKGEVELTISATDGLSNKVKLTVE